MSRTTSRAARRDLPSPADGDAAARGLEQHVKGILDQGGVTVAGPATARTAASERGTNSGEGSDQAASKARERTRSPARLLGPAARIRTGAISPIAADEPSQCTA